MKSGLFGRASALAVAFAVTGWSGQAAAQQSAPPSEAKDTSVEQIIITGSYLAGKEETALPVDVIGIEELSERGAPTMVQLIKTIPSSGSVLGENNRFGGGNGTSTVNLRNLGAQRTLVLFNGRRLGTSIRSLSGVDVNLLPANAISRVEVLKDGAAATYGSDAIGGVVNFISRTDLDGLELTGQYQAIRGSNGDYNLGAAWGWKGDRGNVLLTANYRGRTELPVAERDWALLRGASGYLINPLGGWSPTGNPGAYTTSTVAPVGSPNTGFTTGFNSSTGNLLDIGCAAVGGAPYTVGSATVSSTACGFQYTVFDNLVEKEQNLQLFGQVNFDLTDNTRFHGEVMYATNNTPNQSWAVTGPNQWPAPILATGGSAGGGVSPIPATGTGEQSRFYIPNTNPGLLALIAQVNGANCTGAVLPYGIDAATCATGLAAAQAQTANAALYGVASSQTGWRPVGFAGNPSSADRHAHYSYKTQTFRVEGGFKGTFANGINWDTSANYQQIDYNATLTDLSVNRLQLALRGYGSRDSDTPTNQCTAAKTANFTSGAGNTALGCYYFNPFTNAYATSVSGNTPNPYSVASSTTIAGLNDAAANRGTVFDWMEVEQPNHNTARQFVGDVVFSGDTGFKLWAADGIGWAAGSQYRYDRTTDNPEPIYDALATPCVDSPPFGDGAPFCPTTGNGAFLFNASRRPYDVERKITAFFAEARIPVTEKLEFTLAGRTEEYSGLGRTTNPKLSGRWQALDWLAFRGSVGTTYRAPNATQTTTGFTRGLVNANSTWRANDTYGNPNLKAETADTSSVGALFNYKRINASVDYWTFNFSNPITSESTTDLINIMFPAASPTGNCGVASYLAIEQRFTFSGGCGRGNILSYKTFNINGGAIKTSGYDFQLNVDAGEWLGGKVTTGVDGTYLAKYDESPYLIEGFLSSATGVQKRAGTFRGTAFVGYNRIRANGYVNFNSGRHNFRWQTRYVSGTTQVDGTAVALATGAFATTTYAGAKNIKAYVQHDVTYRVDLPQDIQATITIQNLLDKDPPFAFGMQYNYDPTTVNPLGRVYSVTLKKKF